jgi:hypothetical protein
VHGSRLGISLRIAPLFAIACSRCTSGVRPPVTTGKRATAPPTSCQARALGEGLRYAPAAYVPQPETTCYWLRCTHSTVITFKNLALQEVAETLIGARSYGPSSWARAIGPLARQGLRNRFVSRMILQEVRRGWPRRCSWPH